MLRLADREVTALRDGRDGQLGGEVAGICADPQPVVRGGRGADLFGDSRQATAQHACGAGPDVVVAGQQLGRSGESGLGPGRQVRSAGPLPGVVVGHALLARAVDLHIGGVQVHGDPATQRGPARNREQPEGPLGQVSDGGLDPGQVLGVEPAGQAARRRRGDTRHRRELGRGHVGPLPVQRNQGVPTQQLGLGQANQQLTGPEASSTLLDRPDATVEPADHIELVDELSDSGNPGGGGQRWVRRADAHALPRMLSTAYSFHRQGASPAWILDVSTTSILLAGQAPSSSHTPLTAPLPADPGQTWSTASRITQIDALVHVLRRRAYQADQPL